MSRYRKNLVVTLLVALMLCSALAGPAMAQSSGIVDSGRSGHVQGLEGDAKPQAVAASGERSRSNPFSLLDVGLLAGAGAVLLAAAIAVRQGTLGPRCR